MAPSADHQFGLFSDGIAGVDLSLAYNATSQGPMLWSPSHQQWCVLLSFSATIIRTLGQHLNVSPYMFTKSEE